MAKLAELAEFYGVCREELLPGEWSPVPPAGGGGRALRIDLHRLAELPARRAGPLPGSPRRCGPSEGTPTGPVLTIRERNLQSLAVVYDLHPESLAEMLTSWGVLAAEPGLGPVTHRHPGGYRT